MPHIFPPPADDAVPCRLCGAVQAKPHFNKHGICGVCYNWFFWRNKRTELSEVDFLQLMAREIELKLQKLAKGEPFLVRCEAITNQYQCGARARRKRDGREVCVKHAHALAPTYVGQHVDGRYGVLTDLLRDASQADPQFRKCIERALA